MSLNELVNKWNHHGAGYKDLITLTVRLLNERNEKIPEGVEISLDEQDFGIHYLMPLVRKMITDRDKK